MDHTLQDITRRAEFCLCMGRAFLPPQGEAAFRALAEVLADDLEALATELGHPSGNEIAGYRHAIGGMGDHISLLQLYAQLFLTPPALAPLNAGVVLDPDLLGNSTKQMEAAFRHYGVQRAESFHDQPDHLSAQLEFLALLLASAADKILAGDDKAAEQLLHDSAGFRDEFILSWLQKFCDALEQGVTAHRLAAPYLHLARILLYGMRADAIRFPRATAAAAAPAAETKWRVGAPGAVCRS